MPDIDLYTDPDDSMSLQDLALLRADDAWADYDEQLGYDADHTDTRQYCRHGTFIGSWWGLDYMCGWCESGDEPPTPEEYEAMRLEGLRKRETEFDSVVEIVARNMREHGLGFLSALAQGIYDMADNSYFLPVQELYTELEIEHV